MSYVDHDQQRVISVFLAIFPNTVNKHLKLKKFND